MSKRSVLTVAFVAVLGTVGILLAQQEYPDVGTPEVVLDNDHVVVQRVEQQPGEWTGSHSHDGNQLVVILEESTLLYREDGEEVERTLAAGEVMWIDAVEHDHKAMSSGTAILITLK